MRRFIVLFFVFTTTVHVFSQYSDFPTAGLDLPKINLEQLKFGLKVSPSISWLNVNHNNAFAGGATMKFGVGATARYDMNNILSVIFAINYNSIGGYMADSASLADITSKDYYKINYGLVEVPLGLKINTPIVNKFNYYLQGGVSTGFVLSATEKHYKSVNGSILKSYDILKDLTYPTSVGYFVGIGSRYTISNNFKLFVEVNYKNALTTIANGESYMTDSNHMYNTAISILPANMEFSLGVEF